MTYKYKDYVLKTEIKGNDEIRYLLSCTLARGKIGKSALVIMQNPNRATTEISDQTINKILEVLHEFKYQKVHIANLIPLYATDSAKISGTAGNNPEIYENNDLEIKHTISKVSKFLLLGVEPISLKRSSIITE